MSYTFGSIFYYVWDEEKQGSSGRYGHPVYLVEEQLHVP